nr:hypothetical protein [uncultured Rhodopila sp.]
MLFPRSGGEKTTMNTRNKTLFAAAVATAGLMVSAAYAQVATTLEQAELAGLSAEKRAEVQARAVNGNTVSEVLTTILLNSIKAKHPASSIVALDFGRGVAVVKLADGKIEPVNFDTTTLAINS